MERVVECAFNYRECECVAVIDHLGYRYGYVGVKRNHPLFRKDYTYLLHDDEDVYGLTPINLYFKCYGGITYSGYRIPGVSRVNTYELWWFGFDCCHSSDLPDFTALKRYFPEGIDVLNYITNRESLLTNGYGSVKTQDFVLENCINLAEQLFCYQYGNVEISEQCNCLPDNLNEPFSLNELFEAGSQAIQT